IFGGFFITRIILQEPVEHLGNIGEIVTVADGYARNYLLPTKRAILANEGNISYVKHHLRGLDKKRIKLQAQGEALRDRLASLKLEFERKVGEQGKLFGSVTVMDIAEQISEKGIEIDRRKIDLPEAIKSVGDFKALVKVQIGIVAEVSIVVVGDQEEVVSAAENEVVAESPVAEDEVAEGSLTEGSDEVVDQA
ncbi:MAG: 50S ribosomal protein L9, partial [Deltaproteobacteria bacterium]|nr:50S ribosomal protein L9 [Candidatus Tharpella sp.]